MPIDQTGLTISLVPHPQGTLLTTAQCLLEPNEIGQLRNPGAVAPPSPLPIVSSSFCRRQYIVVVLLLLVMLFLVVLVVVVLLLLLLLLLLVVVVVVVPNMSGSDTCSLQR